MAKFMKFAITSLLSVAIVAGVAWIGASTAPKPEKNSTVSKNTKSQSTVKSENKDSESVNNNIEIGDVIQPGDLKVRYMDVFGAMRECKEGMQETEKLEGVRRDLANNIQAEAKKMEVAMNKFKTESSTLNDSARAKKEQELTKMKRDYDNIVQGSEEQMKLVMQQVTEQLAKEVEQAVIEIAKNERLDAVVDRVTGRVVYTSEKSDYTTKIVKVMNKNYDYKLANSGKGVKSPTAVATNKSVGTSTAAAAA
jgi:outer membrane protein